MMEKGNLTLEEWSHLSEGEKAKRGEQRILSETERKENRDIL